MHVHCYGRGLIIKCFNNGIQDSPIKMLLYVDTVGKIETEAKQIATTKMTNIDSYCCQKKKN